MKTNRSLTAAALAACLFLAASAPAAEPPAPEKRARPQWEHLAFTHDLRGDMSNADVARRIVSLGRDGWELVSVANFTDGGTTTKTTYYFKRQM